MFNHQVDLSKSLSSIPPWKMSERLLAFWSIRGKAKDALDLVNSDLVISEVMSIIGPCVKYTVDQQNVQVHSLLVSLYLSLSLPLSISLSLSFSVSLSLSLSLCLSFSLSPLFLSLFSLSLSLSLTHTHTHTHTHSDMSVHMHLQLMRECMASVLLIF